MQGSGYDKNECERRGWWNGWSKRHKYPCVSCGVMHERGRHLSQFAILQQMAKRQREEARVRAIEVQDAQAGQPG